MGIGRSISLSFAGVGSIDTSSGRVMWGKETMACPGARPGSRFQRLSSMPLTVRFSLSRYSQMTANMAPVWIAISKTFIFSP